MAVSPQAYGLISQAIADAQAGQGVTQRKANTMTTILGAILTAVIAGGGYFVENADMAPAWLPPALLVLGLAATVLGVSKTKNGVTDSVAANINDALNKRIDATHEHVETAITDVQSQVSRGVDDLLAEAKRLAGG